MVDATEVALLGDGRLAKINDAIDLFNQKPKKGVAAAIEAGMCTQDPAVVAQWLQRTSRLDKKMIGEYVSGWVGFQVSVLREFVKLFHFASLGFDDAMRLFLSAFRLPGEAQAIDRVMEAYAREYCRCNPGIFSKTDTAYVLAFSIIMLNTDHFNPNIREDRKMDRSEFISINRGVDPALTEEFLGVVFDRICANEIVMDVTDTHDTSSVMLYTNPVKHGFLEKQGPQSMFRSTWKTRWFVIKNQIMYYLKGPPALGKTPELKGYIPLDGLTASTADADFPDGHDAHKGRGLVLLNKFTHKVKACKITPDGMTQSNHAVFILVAPSEEDRDVWVKVINEQAKRREEHHLTRKGSAHDATQEVTMMPPAVVDKLRAKMHSALAPSILLHLENHTNQSLYLKRATQEHGAWVVRPPHIVKDFFEQICSSTCNDNEGGIDGSLVYGSDDASEIELQWCQARSAPTAEAARAELKPQKLSVLQVQTFAISVAQRSLICAPAAAEIGHRRRRDHQG
jgi:hypothetical protein